jgi:hypothetical protein
MSPDNKETAEQKLLKMIETSSAEEVSRSKKKTGAKRSGGSLAFLRTLNLLLILGLVAASVFLLQELKSGSNLMAQEFDVPSPNAMASPRGREVLMPTLQRLSYYTTPLSRRNLFEPYEFKVQQTAEVTDMNKEVASRTSHLKLVGISWMDSVESASVMLEDAAQATTYFLQKGEKVGDINIKTIYADSVEVSFQDEEIMIYYDIPQQ